MTHIASFIVPESKAPNAKKYAFALADSQASDLIRGKKRDDAQKLMRIGESFFMGTGAAYHIHDVLRQVPDEPMPPEAAAQQIIELGKKLGTEDGPSFIITGEHKNEVQVWHVDTSKRVFGRPDYRKYTDGVVMDGSGIQETIPMLERDMELGLGYTLDLSEGLLRAWNLGMKAHRNLGCSDKLQIGLVGDGKVRSIYHPEVGLNPFQYVKDNLGVDYGSFKKSGEELTEAEIRKMRGLTTILNELYHSLQVQCGSLIGIDSYATEVFGRIRSDRADREKLLNELNGVLVDRDHQKEGLTDFMGTWLVKDVKGALEYLDRFDARRKEQRYTALG